MHNIALMYSGGLDSFIAYHYAVVVNHEKPLPIWVDLGQPYWAKEERAVDRSPFGVKKVKINYVERSDGITPENQVIPARNLLLSLIGAKYARRVWICALESELDKYTKERDKTPEFFHLTSGLFTYVFNVSRPETIVETPFKYMTKTEIVGWALAHGLHESELLATSTCYSEDDGQCGECSTCFKRWVAMQVNGITEKYAKTNPWTTSYAQSTSQKMVFAYRAGDYSHYHPKRIRETALALKIVGVDNELTRLHDGNLL